MKYSKEFFSRLTFLLNILGILGMFLTRFIASSVLGTIFGINVFLAFLSTPIYLVTRKIGELPVTQLKQKMNNYCYFYIGFAIFAVQLIWFGQYIASSTYYTSDLPYIFGNLLGYGSFFGLFLLGIVVVMKVEQIFMISPSSFSSPSNLVQDQKISRIRRILRILGYLIIVILMIVGLLFNSIIVSPVDRSNRMGFFLNMLIPFSEFFALSGLFSFFLLWKLNGWSLKKSPNNSEVPGKPRLFAQIQRVMAIGILLIALINLIPLTQSYSNIENGQYAFDSVFGNDLNARINANPQAYANAQKYFKDSPLSLIDTFTGIPSQDCVIQKDILFYNGTTGVDAGIQLYFDAYLPPNNGVGLPGENSTLIRIHGGAWTLGDKGLGNMLQMNKYFAAQGYCVFDIQYGIKDNGTFMPAAIHLITPDYVIGNFSVDDMIRHIGLFTYYLANHSAEYGANLNSVFVSGGSAGGHLTCATVLAMTSGFYPGFFSNKLTIKGMVPFYPANGESDELGVVGDPFLVDPVALIGSNSPPCLVFQGDRDYLVPAEISQKLMDTYKNTTTTPCAVIWMPMSGHAGDIYYSGHYNQIFLYFMERFLWVYH